MHDAVVGPIATVRVFCFAHGAKRVSAVHAHLKCLTHAKRAMSRFAKHASEAGTSLVSYGLGAAMIILTTSTEKDSTIYDAHIDIDAR
jgi:hypothetical protein